MQVRMLMKVQIHELMQFDEEKQKKKCAIITKKLIFGHTYMEFNDCHDNVKNDGRRIFILKFPRRMKGQLLKVFRVKFLFKPLCTSAG